MADPVSSIFNIGGNVSLTEFAKNNENLAYQNSLTNSIGQIATAGKLFQEHALQKFQDTLAKTGSDLASTMTASAELKMAYGAGQACYDSAKFVGDANAEVIKRSMS